MFIHKQTRIWKASQHPGHYTRSLGKHHTTRPPGPCCKKKICDQTQVFDSAILIGWYTSCIWFSDLWLITSLYTTGPWIHFAGNIILLFRLLFDKHWKLLTNIYSPPLRKRAFRTWNHENVVPEKHQYSALWMVQSVTFKPDLSELWWKY